MTNCIMSSHFNRDCRRCRGETPAWRLNYSSRWYEVIRSTSRLGVRGHGGEDCAAEFESRVGYWFEVVSRLSSSVEGRRLVGAFNPTRNYPTLAWAFKGQCSHVSDIRCVVKYSFGFCLNYSSFVNLFVIAPLSNVPEYYFNRE